MAHKYIYKILFNGNFMIKQFLFFLFLFPIFVFSQNDSIVNGKIVSNANEVEGILVKNISNNQEVVTQRGGYFSIFGKTNDTLMFAARRDRLRQVIEPALAKGQVVLCDRFTDATFAYQGHGRGFDLDVLRTLERWVQTTPGQPGLVEPELTFWFELDPAIAAARLAGARAPDKFESESRA